MTEPGGDGCPRSADVVFHEVKSSPG